MNDRELMNALYKGKTVRVVFDTVSSPLDQKVYTYKCDFDVGVGDLVIVKTPDNRFKVVKVVGIGDETDMLSDIDYKWAISRVPMEEYRNKMILEEALLYKIAQLRRDNARRNLVTSLGLTDDDLKLLSIGV